MFRVLWAKTYTTINFNRCLWNRRRCCYLVYISVDRGHNQNFSGCFLLLKNTKRSDEQMNKIADKIEDILFAEYFATQDAWESYMYDYHLVPKRLKDRKISVLSYLHYMEKMYVLGEIEGVKR